MLVGDIVIPRDNAGPLRSGAESYPDAVCVSLHPFILISREGDMRWSSTVKIEDFITIGHASKTIMKTCMSRLHHDQKAETL